MKITFIPSTYETQLLIPPPKPAAYYIPEWYKKAPKLSEKKPSFDLLNQNGKGIKSCVPFLDSMISGYIQETWQDIVVDIDSSGSLQVTYETSPSLFHNRKSSAVPNNGEFYDVEFVWKVMWMPKLPKGWSAIFTTPFNHYELPFTCGTAIVDSDVFWHSPQGNYPFWIKNGFTGIIPKGTPMYQIIPFKREEWQSETEKFNGEQQLANNFKMRSHFLGAYRKMFHIPKKFS